MPSAKNLEKSFNWRLEKFYQVEFSSEFLRHEIDPKLSEAINLTKNGVAMVRKSKSRLQNAAKFVIFHLKQNDISTF